MLTYKMNTPTFISDNFHALFLSSFMTVFYSYLNVELLGFTMGSILVLLLFILVDFITGVSHSLQKGEAINSKKGRETLYKITSYVMTILLLTTIEFFITKDTSSITFATFSLSLVKHFIFSLMLLWEFHSIGENIQLITGSKPRIFYFVEVTIIMLEKKLMSWLKSVISTNENKKKQSRKDSQEEISQTDV